MTLATFILENIDPILDEWVEFARTLTGGKDLEIEALRDHAKQMLLTVASDMTADQTDEAQRTKSRGGATIEVNSPDSAAGSHGQQRFDQGFSLEELVAEYRALRATVIRLWTRRVAINEGTLYELTRFNEGIDQLLAESVIRFSKQLARARELFMGVLGHDLRTDLQVILTCANRLERTPSQEQIEKYVPYFRESARHILALSEDLLDVARTRLGTQLPIEGSPMNAATVCDDVLRSFAALHPECEIRTEIDRDLQGVWDASRVQQMLTNLLRNAFQHGDAERPITLRARRESDHVLFEVHNYGKAIPASLLARVFEPMQQGGDSHDRTSVGLGLYIASTIAHAHQGALTVTSSDAAGTTFVARLPTNSSRNADTG